MMYDDLKAWLSSVTQLVKDIYTSEPVISVVLTEILFLVIFYGPVDRKGIVGYLKEACRTILGEICQIIEQFIGESKSLTGFSGALHYIFFGRFDDKVKLTMVNYIAIFCSVILFLTSWLALKEFLGYPCGLFLAFVLQIVFLFSSFELGMAFGKKDEAAVQFSYSVQSDESQIIDEVRENPGSTPESGDDAIRNSKEADADRRPEWKKVLLWLIPVLLCICISSTCTYAFIFAQYLEDTIVYDTAEHSYTMAYEYREKASRYREDLRAYLLRYLNAIDEIIRFSTDGGESKGEDQQAAEATPIISEKVIGKIEERKSLIKEYLNHSLIMHENGGENETDIPVSQIYAAFCDMTDILVEETGMTENIFAIRGESLEKARENAEPVSDLAYLFGDDIKFIDESVKIAMSNYIVLDSMPQLDEVLSYSEWLSPDTENAAGGETYNGEYESEEEIKKIANSIVSRIEALIGLPPLGNIDGVRRTGAADMTDNNNVIRVKGFDASEEQSRLVNYYVMSNGNLSVTHRVWSSLSFAITIRRILISIVLSILVNVIFAVFCCLRMRLAWTENPRKNKQLVKSIFLKNVQNSETQGDSCHFCGAALGITAGTLWSLFCSDNISISGENAQLERMLLGFLLGISLAIGLESLVHRIAAFWERRQALVRRGQASAAVRIAVAQTAAAHAEQNVSAPGGTSQPAGSGASQGTNVRFWRDYLTEDALRFFENCENRKVRNQENRKEKSRIYIAAGNVADHLQIMHQLTAVGLAFPVYRTDSDSVDGYVFSKKLLVLLRQCVCEQGGSMQDMPSGFMEDIRDHDEGV